MEDILQPGECRAAIEALLFTMGEAVSVEAMAAVIGCDRERVRESAYQLMEQYESEKRGVRIIELDGAFQMCTSQDMYDYVVRLTHRPKKQMLTDVMLETLSIVAYRQPVTKAEIEQIRGVSCGHAINKLLEYGLITEAGRLNAPGKPILFGTTEEFLRTFGVQSVDSLPSVSPEEMESLKNEAEEEAEMTLDV